LWTPADSRQARDDHFTQIEETMRTLDDQVKSGKLRYVGLSDAPPWKVAPVQTMAHFHGWNPLIALQIEYSLPGWGVLVRALHPALFCKFKTF
jgi:aryl-alcohol dehydrogenase-like predicted oxidoreductase